jgi:hypothetical protein
MSDLTDECRNVSDALMALVQKLRGAGWDSSADELSSAAATLDFIWMNTNE